MRTAVLCFFALAFAPAALFPNLASAARDIASVERINGPDAKVQRSGSAVRVPLKISDTLKESDVVTTGTATSVVLRLGDGSKVNLGFSTEFVILAEEGSGSILAAGFRLVVGWVRFLVQPGDPAAEKFKLKVYTDAGTTGVRGTEFTVQHASGQTIVHVLEGTVYVGPPNATDSRMRTPVNSAETTRVEGGDAVGKTGFTIPDYINDVAKPKGYEPLNLPATPEAQKQVREQQVATNQTKLQERRSGTTTPQAPSGTNSSTPTPNTTGGTTTGGTSTGGTTGGDTNTEENDINRDYHRPGRIHKWVFDSYRYDGYTGVTGLSHCGSDGMATITCTHADKRSDKKCFVYNALGKIAIDQGNGTKKYPIFRCD